VAVSLMRMCTSVAPASAQGPAPGLRLCATHTMSHRFTTTACRASTSGRGFELTRIPASRIAGGLG